MGDGESWVFLVNIAALDGEKKPKRSPWRQPCGTHESGLSARPEIGSGVVMVGESAGHDDDH